MNQCSPNETVLDAVSPDGEEVLSCSCGKWMSRNKTWLGLGVLAAGAAAGFLVFKSRWETKRIEEQVKATMPLQM